MRSLESLDDQIVEVGAERARISQTHQLMKTKAVYLAILMSLPFLSSNSPASPAICETLFNDQSAFMTELETDLATSASHALLANTLMKLWGLPRTDAGITKLQVEIQNVKDQLHVRSTEESLEILSRLPRYQMGRISRRQAVAELAWIRGHIRIQRLMGEPGIPSKIYAIEPDFAQSNDLLKAAMSLGWTHDQLKQAAASMDGFLIDKGFPGYNSTAGSRGFDAIIAVLRRGLARSDKNPGGVLADLEIYYAEINATSRNLNIITDEAKDHDSHPNLTALLKLYDFAQSSHQSAAELSNQVNNYIISLNISDQTYRYAAHAGGPSTVLYANDIVNNFIDSKIRR